MRYSFQSFLIFFLMTSITACGGGGGGGKKKPPTSNINIVSSTVSVSTNTNTNSSISSHTESSNLDSSAVSSANSDSSKNSSTPVITSSSSFASSLGAVSSTSNQTDLVITAEADVKKVKLDWVPASGQNYTLYIATSAECEISSFKSCGTKLNTISNAVPGDQILANGRTYWFQLQSSNNQISNKVFARPDKVVVNNVNAIVINDDGSIYLGGSFNRVGIKTGYAAFFDNSTHQSKPFPYVNGPVYAAISDGAGGFFIGGGFSYVGEKNRQGLAHILADGSVADWNPSVTNGSVYALALKDNSIYVGGNFQSINQGESAANIAVLDITHGQVTNRDFTTNERIRSLIIANNHLFIGGDFTEVNGEPRKYLAQIDLADGLTNLSIDLNQKVRTIVANGTATSLWVGGDFTGKTRNKLIKLNQTNGNWSIDSTWILRAQIYDEADENYSLVYNAEDGDVYSMVKIDNTIYIAGTFTHIKNNGINHERNYLAAVDASSGAVSSWQPSISNSVRHLSVFNNHLYAAGDFAGGIAKFDVNGDAVNLQGTNGRVFTSVPGDSGIFAGGTFTSSKTITKNNLVALNADGSLKADWEVNAESSSDNTSVNSLLLHNNNLYIGGYFQTLNGEERFSLGAVNAATGALITTFNPTFKPTFNPSTVSALAINDGTLYVGGKRISNDPALISLKIPGGEATSWQPQLEGSCVAGEIEKCGVNTLAIINTTLYVGGKFTKYGSTIRNNALCLNLGTNEPTLTSWDPDVNGPVTSIAALSDNNRVFIGGSFDQIKGKSHTNLTAISNGLTIGIVMEEEFSVASIVRKLVVNDNHLYVGSDDKLVNFVADSGEIIDEINMDGPVIALFYSDDNKLYVGGSFTGGYDIVDLP